MNKYLKEILKFFLVFILILLGLGLVFSLYMNSIKKKNDSFAKEDRISYKKNTNRIEYEYSGENIEDIQEEYISDNKDKSAYKIYYPTNIDTKLPLIIWACDKNSSSKDYDKSLASLASYGFAVLSLEKGNDLGDGKQTQEAMDLMDKLSRDKDFALYDKLDIEKIGLAGHGQGACEVVNAASLKDKDKIKSIFLTSLPKIGTLKNNFAFQNKSKLAYDMKKVTQPIFITAGSGKIDSFYCPLDAISENINLIDKDVEAYGAIRKKYDNNLVNNYHALGYMNAWFAYTINKDVTAANAFIVTEELKNNPSWAYVKDNR